MRVRSEYGECVGVYVCVHTVFFEVYLGIGGFIGWTNLERKVPFETKKKVHILHSG